MAEKEEDKGASSLVSDGSVLAEVLNDSIFKGFAHADQTKEASNYLNSKLKETSASRERYFNQLSQYRWNYVTTGIYDIICNDVLTSDKMAGFIISVTDNEELTEELNALVKELGIPKLLKQILPEALHYGYYPLRPNLEDGKGLTGLMDDLEAKDVISIQDSNGFPLLYFVTTSTVGESSLNYSQKTKIKYYGPEQISELTIDDSFIKLKVPTKVTKELKKVLVNELGEDSELANNLGAAVKIRTPLSVIWGVLEKLKNVLMMDRINTYKSLSNLLTPTVLGIPLPQNNDIKQMSAIVNKYDRLINSSNITAVDLERMNFNIQDISSVKVIPISGDRSTPQVVDTGRADNLIDLDRIKNDLEMTLQSIGIPLDAFLGEKSKTENSKINIRYAKKIKKIGGCLSEWLKYLLFMHLVFKYEELDLDFDDIEISMKCTINTDALENLEAQDLIVNSIGSILTLIETMRAQVLPGSGFKVNTAALVENIQTELTSIGSVWQNIFIPGEEPVPQAPEE